MEEEKLETTIPNDIFYAIEYPGNVENVDLALDTLGGMEAIQQSFDKKHKFISLQWPNQTVNNSSHPLAGDIKNCKSLLLRVKRKSSALNDDDYDIIGTISQKASFQGFADFQKRNSTSFQKTTRLSSIDNISFTPSIFSKYDAPRQIKFFTISNDDELLSFTEQNEQNEEELPLPTNLNSIKKKTEKKGIQYSFDIESVPLSSELTIVDYNHNNNNILNEITTNLLDNRPIWSWSAINHGIMEYIQTHHLNYKILKSEIKKFLPNKCYRFNSGPWRHLWIKYGYDPRENNNSRFYQLSEFRSGEPVAQQPVRLKRSQYDDDYYDRDDSIQDIYFISLPKKVSVNYQLCDVCGHEIMDLLKYEKSEVYCTKDLGWLNKSTNKKIKEIMTRKYNILVKAYQNNQDIKDIQELQIKRNILDKIE